jgi:hypothetical protein
MLRTLALLCLPTLLLAGCSTPCPDADELCLLAEALPEAFMSVRAPADDDVWLVGSEAEPDASGPSALHWDGASWERLDLSAWAGHELWWSCPDPDRVTMVGTGGLILEYDRATGAVEAFDGPDANITFFGVWGASPDDMWAVGGDVTAGALPPDLWRRDADGWTRFVDPDLGEGQPGEVYFKVHGASASDLWIVGNRGIALHWDGTSLERVPTDADIETGDIPLATVDATAEPVVAVGGLASGVFLHWDGAAWRDHAPDFAAGVNGVCRRGELLRAVGLQGSVHEWDGAAWTSELAPVTLNEYHACAVSPSGDFWAVGGQLVTRPLNEGVIVYQGAGRPKALE